MLTHARSCPKNSDLEALCLCDADGSQWPSHLRTVPDSSEPLHQPAPAMAARNGTTSPFGKLMFDAGRLMLPDAVGERLQQKAASEAMPLSEYVREILTVHVFGPDELQRLYGERMGRLANVWRENGERDA